MNARRDTAGITRRAGDDEIVAAQVNRVPRTPWRVVARCTYGYPTAIVSPEVLDDGTPFPTYAWLTCPWLAERISARESAGDCGRWAGRVAGDPALAERVRAADRALRAARAVEGAPGTAAAISGACDAVGIAGQRDPLRVKCLHARAALALAGVSDPIGEELLAAERECPDARCERLRSTAQGDDE